jgi:acyl-CoA reductase-like NAD-dependent aldehyde dehydrogenase
MEIMMEETFGPVVGIMKVEGDEEALQLMNDSPYGLVSIHLPASYVICTNS